MAAIGAAAAILGMASNLWKEARVALRQWQRQPAFAVGVITTLALTIGANLAMFAVVDSILLRGLPYASPDRLVWISSMRPDKADAPFTLPEFMDYREETRTLSGLAAYANWSASIAGEGATERFQGARMSAHAFDVLGVSPSAGRLLHESDDRADAPPVAVLSDRLWRRQFGGRADVVGRALRINGESVVIVGVLPAQFPLPLRDVDVVVPLAPDRDPLRHERSSVNFLRLLGRLNPGTGVEQAQSELTAICRGLRQRFPVEYARKEGVRVVPLREAIVGDYRRALLLLLGSVVVVLGTAMANLLSLVLIRAAGRRAEFSIRLAVGGTRPQIARQLAIEALLLAAVGSCCGWLLASWAMSAVMPWVPSSVPRLAEAALGRRTFWLATGLTAAVASLLVAATLAVVAGTRAGDVLRSAGRGAVSDRWSRRIRNVLVVAEIASAVVLVLITTVLIRKLSQLEDVDPGFRLDDVFQARVSIPPGYRSPDDVVRFYERLSQKLAAAPGVRHVGVISVAPMSGLVVTVPFGVADQPVQDERERPSANLRVITPDYLSAVGTRLIAGRPLAETDRQDAPHVALVSAALAERFLSSGALGRRLLIDDNNVGLRPVEVVGLVENVRHSALDLPPTYDVYIPLRQMHPDTTGLIRNNQFWVMQTDSAPATYRGLFVACLREADPDAAVAATGTMRQFLDDWLGPRRFNLGLFGAFTVTAVLLALFGLYALVSYAVSQRQREIGLRMALGASRHHIRRMVLEQAVRVGILGVAAGLAISAGSRRLLASVASGAAPTPGWVVLTSCGLLTVVIVAAWLPARRAANIQPSLALKGD